MIRLFVLNNLLPEKFTEKQTLNYRENIKKLIDQHFTSQSDDPIAINTLDLEDKLAM